MSRYNGVGEDIAGLVVQYGIGGIGQGGGGSGAPVGPTPGGTAPAAVQPGTGAAAGGSATAAATGATALFWVAVVWTLFDKLFVMPHAARRARNNFIPSRFIGMPESSISTGSSRTWAIGKCRVPAHMAWIAKRTEKSGSGNKSNSSIETTKVFADAGMLVNDRESAQLLQLIVQNKLVYWSGGEGRNIYRIDTSGITLSQPITGELTLTMTSYEELAFDNKFKAGDIVKLEGFDDPGTPGAWEIASDWLVTAAVGHTAAAKSHLQLQPMDSQTITTTGGAGTPEWPASIIRVDDRLRYRDSHVLGATTNVIATTSFDSVFLTIPINPSGTPDAAYGRQAYEVFQTGDLVYVKGLVSGVGNQLEGAYRISSGLSPSVSGLALSTDVPGGTSVTITTSETGSVIAYPGSIEISYYEVTNYFPGLFAEEPVWHPGSEDEAEDDTLLLHEDSGTIPAYRGQAMLTVHDMLLTDFGNSLSGIEALLVADVHLTYGMGIQRICERGGLTPDEVDVSGVTAGKLIGYFFQGSPDTVTALSPLLLAKHIVTQEQDDVLAFFQIENAPVVRIRNSATLSDFGVYVGGGQSDRKIKLGQVSQDRLPTHVDVSFQDPDNFYNDGVQTNGLRYPSQSDHDHESALDLRTLTMTRQQARDLAKTTLRRIIVNSDTYEFDLPANYIDLKENTILTFTDEAGQDVTARIVQVDRGQNFLVHIVAVREQLDLAVHGSPVEGSTGMTPVLLPPVAVLDAHVLDIPAQYDQHARTPGLWLAAATSGTWRGCHVYESRDGGTEYELVEVLGDQTTIGVSTDALASGTVSEIAGSATVDWDASNTVNIAVTAQGAIGLASCTSGQATGPQRVNWALLGDEIIAFQNVTLEADGTYTLDTLLRGLRGTGDFVGTHAAGDRFVLLYGIPASGKWRDLTGLGVVGQTLYYKFVPPGASLSSTTAIQVDFAAWNAVPLPVYGINVARNGGGDITLTCDPWSKLAYPLGYTGAYSFDETFEEYVWTVYADNTYASDVATLTDTSVGTGSGRIVSRGFTYTAAEQTTDFGSTQATIYFDVVQRGDYGSGRSVRTSG